MSADKDGKIPNCMSRDCPVPSLVDTVNEIKKGQEAIVELLVEIKHVNKSIEELSKRVYDTERKHSADIGALHSKVERKSTEIYNEISRIDQKFDNKFQVFQSGSDSKIQTLHTEVDSKLLNMDTEIDGKISKRDIIIWLAILTGLVTVASFGANILFKVIEHLKI